MEMYVNNKWTRRLLALLLTACLICALAPAAFAEGEEETGADDAAAKNCKIVVLSTSDDTLKEELKDVEILVDVYQLATIDTTGGKYEYTPIAPFAKIEPVVSGKTEEEKKASQAAGAEMWLAYAQNAAKAIRDAETAPEPVLTLSAGKAITPEGGETIPSEGPVAQGLYLLIAHSPVQTGEDGEPISYWRTVKTKSGDGESAVETETVVSVASSDSKDYLFTPVLVALPYKAAKTNEEQSYSTDDSNPWYNEVTVVLKPEGAPRIGKIKVIKTLSGYVGPDPAQFVFELSGVGPDGKALPSKILSLQFTGDGPKETVEVEFPVGSKIKVVEVYEGSRYVTDVPVVDNVEIKADEVAKAEFKNNHDNTTTGGKGIVNHYTIVEDSTGELIWSKVPAQIKENTEAEQPAAPQPAAEQPAEQSQQEEP